MKLVIVISLFFQLNSLGEPNCEQHLNNVTSIEKLERDQRLEVVKSPNEITIRDTQYPLFSAHGILDNDGSLSLRIISKRTNEIDDFKGLDYPERSSYLSGSKAFTFIYKHFLNKVKSINGFWIFGDNLKKINELTKNKLSLVDSIKETWTAKQAMKLGFEKVKIKRIVGTNGFYELLEVDFLR